MPQSKLMQAWKQWAEQLERETYAVYLAYRDPRVPWYAKVVAACVAAYAFSPIDLVPDPIPILGYLDDLVLVPLGIALAIKTIPPDVLAECRIKARSALKDNKLTNWGAAGVVIAIWLLLAALVVWVIVRAVT